MKVLTSAKAKEDGSVDPKVQISANEYEEVEKQRDQQKSRYEQGETSRFGGLRPRVTSRILLNKWQRQKEDYQCQLKEEEYERRCEEERYEREQAKLNWSCPFFRHFWNEGLKLPTRHNCLECNNQYAEFRQSQSNRRSIHKRLNYQPNGMDRRIKNKRSS
jgi:ferredoxin-like protein FixX